MSNLLPSTPVVENELQQLFPYPSNPQIQEWEVEARAWLVTLLMRLNAMTDDMNSCIKSMPLSQLYQWILSIQNLIRRSNQARGVRQVVPRQPPFRYANQWIPILSWLESLDTNEVVRNKKIDDWLSENPRLKDQLCSKGSHYHLMHNIWKDHLQILKRRKLQKDMQGMQHLTARTPNGVLNNQADTVAVPFQGTVSSHLLKDCNIFLSKRREAFLRYELLTDLWNHLKSLLPRYKQSNK